MEIGNLKHLQGAVLKQTAYKIKIKKLLEMRKKYDSKKKLYYYNRT